LPKHSLLLKIKNMSKPESMPSDEQGGKKPRFTVGAVKRPDGTWDDSKAMSVGGETAERWAKAAVEGDARREKEAKEARERRLKIPDDVKPGTSTMVWHTLRRAEIVNQERLDKDVKEGKADQKTESLIKHLRLQSDILEMVESNVKEKLRKEAETSGIQLKYEDLLQKLRDIPADQMYQYVEEFYIKWLDDLEEQGVELKGKFSNEELRKAAKDLQMKLLDEANRLQPNK
jgi:hypothetical protein